MSGNGIPVAEPPLPEDVFPVLEQVLLAAGIRSPQMLEEEFRVVQARAEADAAAAALRPFLTGSLRYLGRIEDREDLAGTNSYYHPQGSLIARQPVYQWGALRATQRIGRLGAALAAKNRTEAYRELALTIRALFLDLIVQGKAIEVAERREAFAREELVAGRDRLAQGEATDEEVMRLKLAWEETELNLERMRGQREHAMERFLRITGFKPCGEAWIPEEIPSFAGRAEPSNGPADGPFQPWLEMAQLRIEEAEQQLVVERARNRPRIDLIAGIAQDQIALSNRSDIDRTIYFGGVELTWTLFDGHESRARQDAARTRMRLERATYRRLEREAAEEVARLEEAVGWVARKVEIAEQRWELARRELSQREADLAEGDISATALAAARLELSERDLAAAEARGEYLLAAAELASARGTDPVVGKFADFVGRD